MTQPCKICRGTGHVECPNQLCAHWCPCTVCNGTGKVEVWEDWEKGYGEEKVRTLELDVSMRFGKERAERIRETRLDCDNTSDYPPHDNSLEKVRAQGGEGDGEN